MSRKKMIITAIILVLVLAIGGILAYFTDVQTKHNKFKTGKVDILVEEPNWPGNPDNPGDPDKEVPVVPNQEIPKDPQITNQGSGDVYAFVEVVVPVRNVKTGSNTTASPTQLFTFLKEDGTEGINAGWTKVSQTPATADITAETTSVTYVFAYGTDTKLTALTSTGTTNKTAKPVFNKVKFADVTETEFAAGGLQNQSFEVTVNGYGIQKDGLNSEKPSEVWPNVK